jgi:metal-responsive CopG/Arc/MetJ family transcriptional regulator
MSSPDEYSEIEVALDEGLLARVDRLRRTPGYETRSDVVTAAIEAASE